MMVILIFLLVLPLLFQILFGSGIIPIGRKTKFWIVCVISVLLLPITYYANIELLAYNSKIHENRDGLWLVGITALEAIVGITVVVTILIQLLVKYIKNRKVLQSNDIEFTGIIQ